MLSWPVAPFEVTAGPVLAQCVTSGGITAEPAIRLNQLTDQLIGARFESACGGDLSAQLTRVGKDLRTMIGSTCLLETIAQPPDCHAYGTRGATTTELPACATTTSTECWRLVTDAQQCLIPPSLRFDVARSSAPMADV